MESIVLEPVAVIAAIGTILTAVVGAGIRQVWVWGWTYKAMVEERDFWRSATLELIPITGKATQIVADKSSHGS